jgi:uncharacterized protein YjiS (DUF1127 family)
MSPEIAPHYRYSNVPPSAPAGGGIATDLARPADTPLAGSFLAVTHVTLQTIGRDFVPGITRSEPSEHRLQLSDQEAVMIAYNRFPDWHSLRQGLREWRCNARSRAELDNLDDRTLRDIGLSRYQAGFESSRFESSKLYWTR